MLLRAVITLLAENHMELVDIIQSGDKIKSSFSNINAGSTLWFKRIYA
jgi:hypothetical protein